MSRRDSRLSLNVRQTDALEEFENFKKKFLLANKHITKLNSTLSIRIEEINAEKSILYAENIRLRSSEISLKAQLKREQEKMRRVMADAEATAHGLVKHFSHLRAAYHVPIHPLESPSSSSPRAARRPLPNSNSGPSSPTATKLSKPPNVPGIYEEDEPYPSSTDDDFIRPRSSPKRKTPRLSGSRLPIPSRTSSPPPSIVDFTRRKPSRRQSGLLLVDRDTLSIHRPSSPAFGSPVRLQAGLEEEEEENAATLGNAEVDVEENLYVDVEVPEEPVRQERRRSRAGDKQRDTNIAEIMVGPPRKKKARPSRDPDDEIPSDFADAPKKLKLRLKDVTNSPEPSPADTPNDSLPTPAPSVSPQPMEQMNEGARERRTRGKSVNYAEPKLNTKMRKPESETEKKPKRNSAAAIMATEPTQDEGPRSSVEVAFRVNVKDVDPAAFPLPLSRPTSVTSTSSPRVRKSKVKSYVVDDTDDDGADADGEYIPSKSFANGWVNVDGRRRRGFASDEERRHSMAV